MKTDVHLEAKAHPPPHQGKAPYPESIVLDWADYCNLKCMFCWRDQFEKETGGKGGFIDFEKIRKLERPLREAKYLVISSGIGEPLLHPAVDELLPWIYDVNPRIRLRVVTNGTTLTADRAKLFAGHIDWLSISLNASNAQAYLRDMYPHDYKKGVDGTKRWDYFIRRLTEFIAALPEDDRKRIRIQGVWHRDNLADMEDFVRLTARMGASQTVITPMHIREEEQLDLSLYWAKDAYNDTVDEAAVVGSEIGVRLEAARFFTYPKPADVDLNTFCREPLEVAYISKNKLAAPCCHWTDTHIPCDVYSDTEGFDRFWNHDTFRRLRENRNFRSCQVCEITRVFDEAGSHFAPLLRRKLSDSGRMSKLDTKGFYADAELIRVCVSNRLDLPSLRRSLLQLKLPLESLNSIEMQGLAALSALDHRCWDAFRNTDAPSEPVDIPLAGCFTGIGWGMPIHEPQNRTSARWIGGGQIASVFVRVRSGSPYKIDFTLHHVSPTDLLGKIRIAVGDHVIETISRTSDSGRTVISGVVPLFLVNAHDGRLWLRVGCLASGLTPAGQISFTRLHIEVHRATPLRDAARKIRAISARASQAATRTLMGPALDIVRSLIWRPLRARHPILASKLRAITLKLPLGRYLDR